MHLLFFAHKTEAHAFISNGNIKLIRQNNIKFYQSDKFILYLTGTAPKDLPSLSAFAPFQFSKVFNFGIAARINQAYELDEIYKVESFTQHPNNCEKKSAPCLLTQDISYNHTQDTCADFADQEGYYLYNWAKKNELSFHCYKLLSDSGEDNLQHVFDKGKEYSKKLFEIYQQLKML